MKVETGPEALRWIRETSGYTQRELADRSGVSERTIRGLERGQVRRPHPASLQALADAAQLSALHRTAFLRAWRPDRVRSFRALTAGAASLQDIAAEAVLQTAIEQSILYSWTRYVVAPDRTCTVHNRYVLEARQDGLDTYAVAIFHAQDAAPVTFFVGLDSRLLVARPGMTDCPCRTHDPGGVVTGAGGVG